MKILLMAVGKAHERFVSEGVDDFTRRITHYYPASWSILPVPKGMAQLSAAEQKKREGQLILQQLRSEDYLVALDERGKAFTSESLAGFLQQRASESTRQLVFLIGGAFGLDEAVLGRANHCWSLSQLTFPHQLVRLILAEQLYRACSINRNEKYHHR
jgi:23S rRNA (pseudouridine1915-N3)-methyltransferase